MKSEFYRMEFRHWNMNTHDLSLEQEAAYLRLRHAMYDVRGAIPNSPRVLMSLFRCGNNKAAALIRQLIDAGKLALTDDGKLLDHRVMDELETRKKPASAARTNADRAGSENRVDQGSTPSEGRVYPESTPSEVGVYPESTPSEVGVYPESTPSEGRVRVGSTPSEGPVPPCNPLKNNDLCSAANSENQLREEKRREDQKTAEESREKQVLQTTPEPTPNTDDLDPENLAFLDGLFGPADAGPAEATLDDLPAAEAPAADTPEPKPAKLRHPIEDYFIAQDDGFRILHKDLASWEKAYPHINVAGEVMAASGWAVTNLGKANWFHALKAHLGKLDREAKANGEGRKIQSEAAAQAAAKPKSRFQFL